jgi:hypothetical protein
MRAFPRQSPFCTTAWCAHWTEQLCQVTSLVVVNLRNRDEASRFGHAQLQVALAVVLPESHDNSREPQFKETTLFTVLPRTS